MTPVLVSSCQAVVESVGVSPADVGDIVVGSVLAPGAQRANECRMAAFFAGFPETVPVRTVNRQCSSGLQAVADVVASIRAGFYDIGQGALRPLRLAPSAGGLTGGKVEVGVQGLGRGWSPCRSTPWHGRAASTHGYPLITHYSGLEVEVEGNAF